MAVLSVTWCANRPSFETGWPVPSPIYGQGANITLAAGSAQSSTAAPKGAGCVMLHAEAACRVRVGSNPTALDTDPVLGAGQTIFLHCVEGDEVAAKEF